MKKLLIAIFMLMSIISYSQTKRDTIYVTQKIDTLQIIQNYLKSNEYLMIESYIKPLKKEKNTEMFIGGGIGIDGLKSKYILLYFLNMNLISGKWNIGANCAVNSLGIYVSRSIK